MLLNEEMIEAYVSGKLTGAEKALFEAGISKDPLLAREVEFQKDIHSSLMEHRKAELKQRMNNIDMSTATLNTGSKIAASVLISTLVGAGLYLTINMTEQPAQTVAVQTIENKVVPKAPTTQPSQTAPSVVAPQAQPAAAAPVAAAPTHHNGSSVQTAPQTPITVDVPNVQAPENNADVTTSGNNDASNPSLGSGNLGSVKKDVACTIKPATSKGVYSYEYHDNKLFLYGFDKSSKVNILEFNKNGKKQLFVYVNNQYYQIKDNQTTITPLKAITDQGTINQLNGINR